MGFCFVYLCLVKKTPPKLSLYIMVFLLVVGGPHRINSIYRFSWTENHLISMHIYISFWSFKSSSSSSPSSLSLRRVVVTVVGAGGD